MNGWYAMLAFVVAWFIAQAWKTIAGIWGGRKNTDKMNFRSFVSYATRSGGMPSGHAASMTALTTCLGLMYGFDSGLFILSVATTLIVIYDATHVRYAVGKQGEALNKILQENGSKPLQIVEGHTMAQVIVGVILGVLTGLGVYFLVLK